MSNSHEQKTAGRMQNPQINPQKHYICDTNCFYNHANGAIDLDQFRNSNGPIYYSPLTVVELLGKLDAGTFAARKGVAQAINNLKPTLLPDPDSHLVTVFGYSPVAPKAEQARLVIEKLANASSVSEMTNEMKICEEWRANVEKDWLLSLQSLLKERVPAYASWLANGMPNDKRPRISKKADQVALKLEFSAAEFQADMIAVLHNRALQNAIPHHASVGALVAGVTAVDCYCKVFTRFLFELLTTKMTHEIKEPNDSHDLEYFLYCRSDNWVFATAEKFWNRMASDCGMSARVIHDLSSS
jgi:hypothetical protein